MNINLSASITTLILAGAIVLGLLLTREPNTQEAVIYAPEQPIYETTKDVEEISEAKIEVEKDRSGG